MQEVASRSRPVDLFPTALERSRPERLEAGARAREGAGTVALWRQTLHILGAHSAPILAYALFGLIGANLAGVLFSLTLLVNAYAVAGSYVSYASILYPQLLIQGSLGAFTFTFARGAITWIALNHGAGRRPGIRDTFAATLRRWPALLAQSLLYGMLITLGVAGLTLLLRDLHLDVTTIGRVNGDLGDMTRAVAIRALGTAIPDPGPPFSELYSYARYTLSRSAYYSWYLYRYASLNAPAGVWLIGLGSALLIVVVEALARLRTVMAMRTEGPGRIAGLLDSARAGWRYFGFITAQVWLLRLAMLGAVTLFTLVPITFLQSVFVPAFARQVGSYWPYAISSTLFTLGGTLVGMLFTAFAVVYDTRIYVMLAQPVERQRR